MIHLGDGEVGVHADVSEVKGEVKEGVKKALTGAEEEAGRGGKRTGSSFFGAMFGALTGATVIEGLKTVGNFLGDSLQEAADAARIGAVVENAIKETGAAARGITVDAFSGVAKAIGKSLVVDDDDIAQGLAPLLRIPELTKPVFDKLAQAAADASAATGKDLGTVSAALSRLATDPEAAIGALRGLGVQVSETTKEAVKGFVAQGDQAGALNLILDELNSRYKGAAKAAGDTASPQQKLGVALGDLKEKIGGALVPALAKFTEFLVKEGPIVGDFVNKIVAVFKQNWPQIKVTVIEVLTTVKAVITGFVDLVTVIWDNFGTQIFDIIKIAFELIKGTIVNALKVIQGIVKVVTGLIHGDWGLVWDGIKQIISAVWDQIGNIIEAALGLVKNTVSISLDILKGLFSAVWGQIKDVVRAGVAAVVDLFLALAESILRAADVAFGWIPGLGGKLHEAHKAFEEFRDNVNASLRGIDRTIDIDVRVTGRVDALGKATGGHFEQFALGGVVPGPIGRPVPAIVHGGETVRTPAQEAALGGSSQSLTINVTGQMDDEMVERIARRVSMIQGMAAVA